MLANILNAGSVGRDLKGVLAFFKILPLFAVFISLGSWQSLEAAEPGTVQIRSSMSWYTTGTMQSIRHDSPYNPDNTVLELDTHIGSLDLRPNLKLNSGNFQLIARPQFVTSTSKTKKLAEETADHAKSKAKWSEVYGNMTASDKVIVSYGLQNYQWGAAESFNPSNRIYHESVDQKNILSMVESKNIMRANLTWTKNFSTVLMSETEENPDNSEFRAEEAFETKALMKHEFNWNNGADYIGLVYGSPETGSQWVGEYFNMSFDNGISIYADAAHQKHSEAWYPVTEDSQQAPNQKVVQMRQAKSDDPAVFTLGVAGFRYSFEDGSDLRLEYIVNTGGWTTDDFTLSRRAVDRANPLQLTDYKVNLKRVLKPGLEYRGQKYTLVSVRVPDAMYTKDLVIYGRCLRSMTDFSALFYGSLEYSFWSSSTLLLSALTTQGDPTSELRGVVDRSFTAGLRQDF